MTYWDHQVIGPVATNCYIFSKTGTTAMVDPGGPEAVSIANSLLQKEVEIKDVLVSHGHFDHLSWSTEVKKVTDGARVYLHKAEKPYYEEYHDWLQRLGMDTPELREPDVWIEEGDLIQAGGYSFEVIHTPGHSPGSATYVTKDFYWKKITKKAAFVGDCLFKNSIGRVDLPYCDPDVMENSLRKLMRNLEDFTTIFPGHMDLTDMRSELDSNPYLKGLQNNIRYF